MHTQKLKSYLYVVREDGSIVAQRKNCAVSENILKEIHTWKMEGATDQDVLCRLRASTDCCRRIPLYIIFGTLVSLKSYILSLIMYTVYYTMS